MTVETATRPSSVVKPLVNIKPGMKFKAKKRVTDVLIKLQDNMEYLVRFDEAMYRAEDDAAQRKVKEGAAEKKPPMLCRVTMLDTGEQGVIIVPMLLEKDLNRVYPDNGYVGGFFAIQKVKIPTKGGQTVNVFQIVEIEEDAAEETVDAQPVASEAEKPAKKSK